MLDRPTLIGTERPAPAPSGPVGLLVVGSLQPALVGAFFELSGQPCLIGRSRDAAVHLDDEGTSRLHARVERGPGGEFVAFDLDSTNGTFLNGVRIHSAALAEGDVLRIGATALRFGTAREVAGREAPPARGSGAFVFEASAGRLSFSGGVAARYQRPSQAARQLPDAWGLVYSEAVDADVDVTKVVLFAMRVAEGEARRHARIVKELAAVPGVLANEARLGQVFINLILNAAQAIPEGRPDLNEIRLTTRFDARAGRVVVEVSDTGSGIRPEILRRIFDPFFTTKPAGVGTGLGLFVCQGILASLGGDLTVESTVGRGSTFRVTLPASPQRSPAPGA